MAAQKAATRDGRGRSPSSPIWPYASNKNVNGGRPPRCLPTTRPGLDAIETTIAPPRKSPPVVRARTPAAASGEGRGRGAGRRPEAS